MRVGPDRLSKRRGRRRSRTPRLSRGRALLSRQPRLPAGSSSAAYVAATFSRHDECVERGELATSCYGRRRTKRRLPISGEEFWIRTKVSPKGCLRSLAGRFLFACKLEAVVVSREEERGVEPHTPRGGTHCFRNKSGPGPVFLPLSVASEGIEPTTRSASNCRSTF